MRVFTSLYLKTMKDERPSIVERYRTLDVQTKLRLRAFFERDGRSRDGLYL